MNKQKGGILRGGWIKLPKKNKRVSSFIKEYLFHFIIINNLFDKLLATKRQYQKPILN